MAESEKERFVTYYFSGLNEETYPGVDVVIVPSPKVPTYDVKPEMSVYGLVKNLQKRLERCEYQFVVMNIANPDMVAHSGNLEATVKAVEHTDKAIGAVEQAVLAAGGLLIITADHGNAEELLTFPRGSYFYTTETGGVNTEHSNNKVPAIFITDRWVNRGVTLAGGALADVAPTILAYLKLELPEGMTGRNLLDEVE
jgi:2,3-bisphosphoglycerate-independent phosphoglycerate mutase